MKSNGKGKKRTDVFRQRRIRAVLVRKGIRGTDIARKLQVSKQIVCNVMAGRDVSRRVVEALIEAGVPKSYFKEYAIREDDDGQLEMQSVQNG